MAILMALVWEVEGSMVIAVEILAFVLLGRRYGKVGMGGLSVSASLGDMHMPNSISDRLMHIITGRFYFLESSSCFCNFLAISN
jgi:hypothetical protein